MLKQFSPIVLLLVLASGTVAIAQRSNSIPSGTEVTVRTDTAIKADAETATGTRIYNASVSDDVMDDAGNVLIPRGSPAQLAAIKSSDSSLMLDLRSISVRGRRYTVEASDIGAPSAKHGGIGKNKRTGEYVGGGALAGTVIGAITGGGKGAAIGALAGGAVGAGAQVLTRGKKINVPAEARLKFRLEEPLMLQRPSAGSSTHRRTVPPSQ